MDYAAALRTAPSGPAIKLDTTPLQKAQPQKEKTHAKPTHKPVETEEPSLPIEEEKLATDAISSAPTKPPSTHGLAPIVRFFVTIPSEGSVSKESGLSDSANIEPDTDSSEETEDVDNGEETTPNAGKSGKKETSEAHDQKSSSFSAQDLENNFARLSELVALLERHAEERHWELEGGFRFTKSNKNNGGKSQPSRMSDLELPTVTLSLKWLSAIIELLRSKTSTNIAVGGGSFISIARVENQLRVVRYRGSAGKEIWLQMDDVVLDVREQAKLYLQVANRVEQILERRESQLADKERKDAAKKRRVAISAKLQTAAFTSMLDTLQGLLASSTEFPALTRKFLDQEAALAQQRRRLKEENQDMLNILLAAVPASLLETNLQHIAARLEPEELAPEAAVETTEAAKPAEPAKKLSKKEAALAAAAEKAAEAERLKKAEEQAEAVRKAAEATRKKKAEELAAQQAAAKQKAMSNNPFADLASVSEEKVEAIKSQTEEAREHQIKKTQQAKKQQEEQQAREAAQKAKEKTQKAAIAAAVASEKAKNAPKSAAVVEEPKKASAKELEDKKKAATKEAEDKKKAEQAAAAAKKAEKPVVAEKPAPKKKEEPKPVVEKPAEKKPQATGPDRSEKKQKAEKIEADKREKKRQQELKALTKKGKGMDKTTLYTFVGVGSVVVIFFLYMVLTQLSPNMSA